MVEDAKLTTEETEESGFSELQSMFSFQNIYALVVVNWQWFLLSLFICLCAAYIYMRYTVPVYQVSAKMLIKDDNSRRRSNTNMMLSNMQDLGFLTNSAGIENEIEILQSTILSRDAVKDLKMYVEYKTIGRIMKPVVFGNQPVSVDLDAAHLDQWDKELLDSARMIQMNLSYDDGTYKVKGETKLGKATTSEFSQELKSLPATIRTKYGTLTFTKNPNGTKIEDGAKYGITIRPPMQVGTQYAKALDVAPTSKQTSIAQMTLKDVNYYRGLEFLRQLAVCYNRQANSDKNEIALKTEEFINSRLEKINAELGSTEDDLENYKRRNALTRWEWDASISLTQSSELEGKLLEANAQIQLMDYLREFIDNPANQYKIIPSNIGMSDQASGALISSYNQTVQDRNRLLKAASEQSPQVLQLTTTLDDLQPSIRTALLQARRSADITRQNLQKQLAKYQGRIGETPDHERMLTQIGRQQEVKSSLYILLLQKREENSISLVATADKGKLIDEPQLDGQVNTKRTVIMLATVLAGLLIPLLVLMLMKLLSYRLDGREELMKLTRLPIIADVPVASDSAKTAAGIVVQANKNNQIDEIFRSMRTNIQFMMKEQDKVILFTSSTSGEGKTFLAANLAVSFALLGKKVVLCGLDIRKPALGRLFNVKDRTQGITNLLKKDNVTATDVQTVVCPSGVNENLDLLLAGPTPPNPTELLARESLKDTIEILKTMYDYIILDTAPVGLVTDTLQIARFANVNCYVCRADYTPKSNIGILNTLADEKKLENCCVILNGVDMSKKKHGYYYGYGKYGKYGRYGYGRYGYGRYGYGGYGYGSYGNYGSFGNYADSRYSNKDDNSIKK